MRAYTYVSEADSFLAKRDGSVQPRQIAAILDATAGRTNDLNGVRQARNAMAPLPEGVEAEMVSPKMRLYRPKGGRGIPLLVYLHGGGWVIGSIASCSAFCGELAAKGCAVLALDYPLAPEHPYPEALDFTCAAYRDIVAHPDRDVLRDQGKAFADRLRTLGAGVRYELPVGSTHLFVTVPGQSAAFRRAVDFAYEAVGGRIPNCK